MKQYLMPSYGEIMKHALTCKAIGAEVCSSVWCEFVLVKVNMNQLGVILYLNMYVCKFEPIQHVFRQKAFCKESILFHSYTLFYSLQRGQGIFIAINYTHVFSGDPEKGHVKKGNPDMANVLDGKLMYLKMVKGEDDSVYLRLKTKFDTLVHQLNDTINASARGVTYVETTPLLEFEKKNGTVVEITMSKQREEDASEPFVPHRFATFSLGGKKHKASVNKTLKPEEETQKDILSISHCRDTNGKQFWLIHRSDKVMVRPADPVNIDDLNKELDDLLS